MRAAVIGQGATAPHITDVEAPTPQAGRVGIVVRAAALNPVDLLIAAGEHPTIRPARPYIPGFEGVGEVAGDAATAGRRVWWLAGTGALAERATAAPDQTIDVPAELADDQAVAIGIAGMAAWLALVERARLQPGERVLVLGATGAVGRLALQLARLLGADRVVAAARSADDALLALGADTVVRISPREDLAAACLEAEPRGFDVILDPLFGPAGEAAIESAAEGGRVVVLGALAGPRATLSTRIFERGLSIIGHRNSATPVAQRRLAYREMASHTVAGRLTVDRDVVALDELPGAWHRQAASPHRKLVVIP